LVPSVTIRFAFVELAGIGIWLAAAKQLEIEAGAVGFWQTLILGVSTDHAHSESVTCPLARLAHSTIATIATSEAPSVRVAEKRLGRAPRIPGISCRELPSGRSAGAMVGGRGLLIARRLANK
jgi:hypothetical protein